MNHDAGDALVGTTLGGYRIEAKLGTGATGVVFRARRDDDATPVALKVLHENLGGISSLRGRFEREARLLTKLEHPNIVKISEFGVSDDRHTFIAMELLEGRTLEQRLDLAPLPPSEAIAVFREAIRGLAFAHQQRIVHRDLKPANVFLLAPDDRGVKLLDFGLAKMLSDDEVDEDGTLTRRGRIVGTPAYMAPEQITGTGLDVRADVYATGVLLFELLADRRPFVSERRSELLRAHLLKPPPHLSEVRPELEVDAALEALIMRCLAKAPESRYADAGALLQAVEALPPNAARLVRAPVGSARRSRAGATSEIISDTERRAVSESATGVFQRDELLAQIPPNLPPRAATRASTRASTRPRDGARAEATEPQRESTPSQRPASAAIDLDDARAKRARAHHRLVATLYGAGFLLLVAAAALWWFYFDA